MLSRLDKYLLAAFLFWLGAGVIILPLGVDEATVMGWSNLPPWLRHFMALCLEWGGVIQLLLAASITHLMTTQQWGSGPARRWAVATMIFGGVLEAFGTLTGVPFGQYYYTENFGPKIAGILPVTIPLAWFVVATNFLLLVRRHAPYVNATQEAALVGTGAMLYDWLMEPFAVQVERYWYWTSGGQEIDWIPWQNYLTWWVAMFLIARLFAPTNELRFHREWRPHIVLGGMVLIFIVGRIANGV
ncbi:MAG: carotenoid biosynthesis protein [Verrucomicrobiota bacterium]